MGSNMKMANEKLRINYKIQE